MKCKQIEFNSTDYHKSIVLRDEILRKPLGLSFSKEFLEEEKDQIHLGLFEENNILGILLLKVLPESRIKMRQVAIDDSRQREGLGRLLVEYSEEIARKKDAQIMELNAREVAVPFYLSLDYEICSEKFFELGIAHYKMEKYLLEK